MGYDMRWIRKPEGEAERVEEARKAFYAACDVRDELPRSEKGSYTEAEWQERKNGTASFDELPANATERYRTAQAEVSRLMRELDKADRSYFRLNIFGMSRVVDAMLSLGAAYDGYEMDKPDWPDCPEGYYDWEDGEGEWTDEQVASFRAYEEARQKVVDWSPEGYQGIPAHKFGSNDGWHVLPEEAFYAASAIRAADPDAVTKALEAAGITGGDWPDYWGQWVQWLADSSEHGGFEVH